MYPVFPSHIPDDSIRVGRHELRFCRSEVELDAIYRLRFDVFNLELNEGFDASFETERDTDEFDPYCHHLYVVDRETDQTVGTYRMQTHRMALEGIGLYSATEFDFSGVPEDLLTRSVEIGRACIHRDHRNLRVLYLLWKGLGAYMSHNNMRYLFGCCSLTSQNEAEGLSVLDLLESKGHILSDWEVQPLPGHVCRVNGDPNLSFREPKIPRLMRAYLSLGAKICGPPAIDRVFKTIDYLALFDVEMLSETDTAFYQKHG